MNNDHVHSATAKLKTTSINFALFVTKPPNKIPSNISGSNHGTFFVVGTCTAARMYAVLADMALYHALA